MLRPTQSRSWLLMLLCVVLLVVRVGGAHLHLCLDGNEPPVSFHPADDWDHQPEIEIDTPHDDVDVAVSAASIAKSGKQTLDVPLLPLVPLLMWLLLPPLRHVFFSAVLRFHLRPSLHLRPPFRGPPALTSC